jgi:hypothetical protein
MKKIIALLIASAFVQASAAPLLSDAGLTNTVTFDEVSTNQGTAVTNQFTAQGVTFSASGQGNWESSGNPAVYSNNAHFAGTYLDNFSSQSQTRIYSIQFGSTASAAGAWFEFNISSPAATFSSYLGNVLQESYIYNNGGCCDSAGFVGFTGHFDEIRVSDITNSAFIMDTLSYTPDGSVPEPGTIALLGAGLLGVGLGRRVKKG